MKIDLSIIVLSYNTKDITLNCLSSVVQFTRGLSYEIMVVDNASADDSVELVKKKFPEVVVIENEKNYGFASANNRGIKKSRGKYILFLNNDVKLDKNCIKELLNLPEG